MKSALNISLFFLLSLSSHSQNLTDFFENQNGKQLLGFCAHVTNTYSYGKSYIGSEYVTVDVHYKDLNLNNASIVTEVKLRVTDGPLPFTSIIATYDNDWVNPFAALGLSCWYIQQIIQNSNPQDYARVRNAMVVLLNTDMNYWNGADWALFAMNLLYLNYENN